MRQTSERGENLNRTRARESSTMTKLSAEKKEKLELNKERSEREMAKESRNDRRVKRHERVRKDLSGTPEKTKTLRI